MAYLCFIGNFPCHTTKLWGIALFLWESAFNSVALLMGDRSFPEFSGFSLEESIVLLFVFRIFCLFWMEKILFLWETHSSDSSMIQWFGFTNLFWSFHFKIPFKYFEELESNSQKWFYSNDRMWETFLLESDLSFLIKEYHLIMDIAISGTIERKLIKSRFMSEFRTI